MVSIDEIASKANLIGKVDDPNCLAYWRNYDKATGGKVIDRFCYYIHELVINSCFDGFQPAISDQLIRQMMSSAEGWYQERQKGKSCSKSNLTHTHIYILTLSDSLGLTVFRTHEDDFISFVHHMYARLRKYDDEKTIHALYRQETSNDPSYGMYNFMKPLSSWEVFRNIQRNADLRTRSKYLHLIAEASGHFFLY